MTQKSDIETAFRRHYATMYRLAIAIVHDHESARDIVHDTYGAENEAYKLRVWENAVDCFLYQCVMIDLGRTWPQNEAYKKFASFYIVFTYEPVFRGDSGEKVYMAYLDSKNL